MSIYINNIFLIDLNIISEDNSNNLENIQEIFNNFNIISYSKISDLFDEIKKDNYKYKLINIIIIDELYDEFINKLDEELSNIFYIPIIYVLSSDLENFNELIKNFNNEFYLIGGVHDSYESIYNKLQEFDNLLNKKEFQFEEKKIFDLNQIFIFQRINNKYDLILLFLFKFIINSENISKDEFELLIDYLYNNFSKEKVFDLFKPSLIIKTIPFQILIKWWLRAFSLNSKLNNNLKLEEKINNTFIKILYKSFDINSIDFYNEDFNLYRTQIMNENEYKKLLNDFNKKKENFPFFIVFSNNFVNFFKSIEIVNSIRLESNENQISILFELKNFKNKNFIKGIDLHNYSFYPNEKEIIFLPFSSFCVENIEDDEIGKKISLIYIDNYFNEDIQKILKNKENLSEIISQSNEQIFVKNIIESKIINNVENFEDFEKIINEKIENDFDNNVKENDYVQTNFYQINKNEFHEILYLNLNNESEEERSSENEKENNQINSYEKDENEKENKLILKNKENNLDKNIEQNLIKFYEPIIYYNLEYKQFLDKKLNSITFNIKFKNIGNIIWNEKYSLKLKNLSLFNLQSFNLEKKIKPNEEFNAKIIINLNKSEIKINKTYILEIYLYDENNKEIQNDKQIINITVNKFISLTKDDYSTLYMKLINTNHSNMKDVTLEKIENDINNELNNIKIISYSQKNKILSNLFNKLSKKYKGIKK